MGGTPSTTMESQRSEEKQRFHRSDDQNPQNGIVPQNPQFVELGFVKPQSLGTETTPVSSSDPSSSVIDAELKRNQPQMVPVASKEWPGVGDRIDYQNGLDEDGNLRKTLDEEIHQVIYKEALNEAVMNLALMDDRNWPREEESPFFDLNRAVEVGNEGNNDGLEVWEGGSDMKTGKFGNVDEIQEQNGNDEAGSEEEEEENYGNEEASGYSGDRSYNRRLEYPLRVDSEDCAYYMKTGNCKFGMNCKFNHPPKRRNQV